MAPLDILHELYEPWAAGDADVEVHNHFTTDAVTVYLEYRQLAERGYAADGAVGWNPLAFGGNPEYANTMAAHDDWSMHLHRVFDFWVAWHLGLIGHFLIASVGMWVFLRSRSLRPAIALAGALAYAGNSQFILWIYHRWQLAAFAWMPWALWAMYRFREGRRSAWFMVTPLLALALLGGTLQQDAFVLLAFGAVGLTWVWTSPGERRRWTLHLASWAALGLGVAGFALLPASIAFLDNVATGHIRGTLGEGWSLAGAAISVVFLGAQALPFLLGSPQTLDVAKLLDRNLFDIAYFGFLPVVLSYRSLFSRAAPAAARTLMAVGLLTPLTPLVGPLYFRVQIVFVLGGVWAFCWYWQYHAAEEVESRFVRVLSLGSMGALALWALASVAIFVARSGVVEAVRRLVMDRLVAGEATFGAYRLWILERASRFVDEAMVWAGPRLPVVGAAGLAIYALRIRRRHSDASHLLLLAAVLVELALFTKGWVTAVDPARFPPYPVTTDLSVLQNVVRDGRVIVLQAEGRPQLLPANTLVMYGIANIDQYESIRPPSMWQQAGFALDSRTLGALAVTHAVSYPDSAPEGRGWRLVYRGDTLAVWENTLALPRYLGLDRRIEDWDQAVDLVEAAHAAIPVDVAITTPNRRLLRVTPPTAFVRIAENWSEGWMYRAGGTEWKPVARGPDGSLTLDLPRSDKQIDVEVAFLPRRREVGVLVSAIAGGFWVAGGFLTLRRGRQASRIVDGRGTGLQESRT